MKHKLNRFIYRLLSSKISLGISANRYFQKILEKNVEYSYYLMGIGTGSAPDTSGEFTVLKMLKQGYVIDHNPLCIFDVGANKGQFAELIINQIGDIPFRSHCFEPGKLTFDILHKMIGDHRNFTLNNCALGRQGGKTDLFYDEPGSGLASLSKRRLKHYDIEFSHSEKVKVDTLDNYCKNNDIQTIDLLKLDVEGHELDVLYGGINKIRDNRVKIISFEFGGCNVDTRIFFQDFFYFFNENGNYDIFRITPSGYLSQICNYSERYEQFSISVFIAISRKGEENELTSAQLQGAAPDSFSVAPESR